MKKNILLLLVLCISHIGISQEYFPKNDGVKENNAQYTLLLLMQHYLSLQQTK